MQGRPIALQLAYTQGLRTRDEYLTILDILAPAISLQFVEYTTKRQPQYDFSRDRDSLCFGSVEVQGTKMHFFQHLLIGAQEIPSFFGMSPLASPVADSFCLLSLPPSLSFAYELKKCEYLEEMPMV